MVRDPLDGVTSDTSGDRDHGVALEALPSEPRRNGEASLVATVDMVREFYLVVACRSLVEGRQLIVRRDLRSTCDPLPLQLR